MELKVLKSSLDKGESWEKKNTRVIEVSKSSDSPDVYFGIMKKSATGKISIVEDFFFEPGIAKEIAKALIKEANEVEKATKDRVLKRSRV